MCNTTIYLKHILMHKCLVRLHVSSCTCTCHIYFKNSWLVSQGVNFANLSTSTKVVKLKTV